MGWAALIWWFAVEFNDGSEMSFGVGRLLVCLYVIIVGCGCLDMDNDTVDMVYRN